MPRFRKKPIEIFAIQFFSQKWVASAPPEFFIAVQSNERTGDPYIETLEGPMRVSEGDWIIKGVNGEFYPCKPEIFEKTYEAAE